MHGRSYSALTPPSDRSDGCGAAADPAHSLHRGYFVFIFVLYCMLTLSRRSRSLKA